MKLFNRLFKREDPTIEIKKRLKLPLPFSALKPGDLVICNTRNYPGLTFGKEYVIKEKSELGFFQGQNFIIKTDNNHFEAVDSYDFRILLDPNIKGTFPEEPSCEYFWQVKD